MAVTAHDHELWSKALPLMALMAFGQGLLVSPLSTAVMTSEDDRDAIVGSGVNNAISRSAWLLSVAAMGAVAALVFRLNVADSVAAGAGVSFGLAPATPRPADVDVIRIAANDSAYAAVAWITAGLVGLSALLAAATFEWKRRVIGNRVRDSIYARSRPSQTPAAW